MKSLAHSARPFLGAGLLLAALLAAGCNSRPVVSGTVKYKGEIVTTGEVSFIGADGTSRSGLIGPDGRYEIIDPPKGDVTVVVVSTRVEGAGKARGSALAGLKTEAAPIVRSVVPVKYGDPKTSDLKHVVVSGAQTKNIDLTD
jgi:hypothetical protein